MKKKTPTRTTAARKTPAKKATTTGSRKPTTRARTRARRKAEPNASEDPVKSPSHYTPSPVFEVIDLTNVLNLNGNLAQSLQYIARAGRKGEKGNVNIYCQELEKAIQFLTFELRRVRGEPVSDTLRKFVAWPEK